ncbi:acyl-homoserine lactone acylase PvdQ [Saccharothrix tamanrassetensis]|uniref:Acyl-homoserine lactone acylase PvdQ n=1 Tax=Saccharothrix tamanrassetensis TaxID=1051531 RepID=A0A841CCZ7_9PSEU|nr:penicillin acylase family protein [Saccharothrix tamanrassetensis]MBB5956402.1 acyl-homoserine lactone acylase PvdQ [Saccharothrix tamanrassetensis]
MRRAARSLAVVALLATAAITVPAAEAAPETTAFTPDDHCLGQCHDVLPPGQNGNATLAEILAHKALGTRPAHSADRLGKYDALVSGYSGLTNDQLGEFFDDASFGVPAGQVESTVKPRADVTIIRDKTLGMPHIYGTTRSGTEFGAGYAAAQDRLWLMDLFRHLGRGQLTGFAGGAEGNRVLEQSFFNQIPYTEADLQRQIDQVATRGPRGQQAVQDVTDYVAGINAYLTASVNGRYFPGEYVLTGHADAITNRNDIQPFKTTDLVAIAAVVGGLFGAGGGGEVQNALVKLAAQNRYGATVGERVWRSFRQQDDPEAVLTVHDGRRFPYATTPADPQGVALPDGAVTPERMVYDQTSAAPSTVDVPDDLKAVQGIFADGVLPADLLTKKHGMSNALAVSGAHTDTGNPIAVWGPQTGYFAPQLLMLQELNGPGIRARGVSFAGVSMYVQLGRGIDYSWSATSAGQDITDTYAVELCEPDGRPAGAASVHYRFRSECLPMERIERKNAWRPTVADPTPAGSYALVMYRTKYGLVQSRAQVGGKHVAYTSLRSTYLHEVDSIIGFQEFNDPEAIKSPQDFQRAAEHIGYAFNWFYVDSKDTAYFNSGANPVRKPHVDPNLPIKAEQANEWEGWNPDRNTASYTPFDQHPNSINQDYYISWNNRQALGYAASGYGNGSVHRGDLLDDRMRALISGGRKVTRTSLTQAMAEAGVADLRAEQVLPDLLRVIDTAAVADPALAATVGKLRDWQRSGSLRKETSRGSKAYAHADAIRVLDAWWPILVRAQFRPGLGDALYTQLTHALQVDEAPSDAHGTAPHKGSSFQHGWWSYVDKDLRTVLGDSVAGPLGAEYCGGGDVASCRQVLLDSLAQAAAVPTTTVYPGDASCAAGDQWCADTVIHRAMGGITHDKIHWQNRPTYQQVVQFPSRRGTDLTNLAFGAAASAGSYERGWYRSPPGNAVDGRANTRWASDWSDHQWLQVDLRASRTVGRVVLSWEAAYAKSYRIEVSTDGTRWREVFATKAGDGGQDLVAFPPTATRFVRMTGTQRATSYGYSLYELEVYVT